jgi:hypothetical protein
VALTQIAKERGKERTREGGKIVQEQENVPQPDSLVVGYWSDSTLVLLRKGEGKWRSAGSYLANRLLGDDRSEAESCILKFIVVFDRCASRDHWPLTVLLTIG